MLRSLQEILNYSLLARDGKIGRCKDFLFDDELWTIRYMVADTAKWLPGRKVLVSPISLGEPDWVQRQFSVNLTREQIENGPLLDEHAPVSRLYEKKYFGFYYWPYYWTGGHIWGTEPYPTGMPVVRPEEIETKELDPEKSHLRSAKEVKGYHIQATDGKIGHVEDFIIDDKTWTIQYLVVDTRNWLPGRKVLVAPEWVESVSWGENLVIIGMNTKEVEESPEYDPSQPVNREYELRLYDYYGRPTYWN